VNYPVVQTDWPLMPEYSGGGEKKDREGQGVLRPSLGNKGALAQGRAKGGKWHTCDPCLLKGGASRVPSAVINQEKEKMTQKTPFSPSGGKWDRCKVKKEKPIAGLYRGRLLAG